MLWLGAGQTQVIIACNNVDPDPLLSEVIVEHMSGFTLRYILGMILGTLHTTEYEQKSLILHRKHCYRLKSGPTSNRKLATACHK